MNTTINVTELWKVNIPSMSMLVWLVIVLITIVIVIVIIWLLTKGRLGD